MSKRIYILIAYLGVIMLLQTTLIELLRFDMYMPDLIFVFVVYVCLFSKPMLSMPFVFITGIFVDALSYNITGVSPLLFVMIAYSVSLWQKKFMIENPVVQFVAVFAGYTFYSIVLMLFSESIKVITPAQRINPILLQVLYTSAVAPFLVVLLRKLDRLFFGRQKKYEFQS